MKSVKLLRVSVMMERTWAPITSKARSNVGCGHQIRQRLITEPYSNATKTHAVGSWRARLSRNGRYGETPFYGFMAFLDVARRSSARLLFSTLKALFRLSLSSTFSLPLLNQTSSYLRAWSARSSVNSTINARMLRNKYIRCFRPAKMDIDSQPRIHCLRLFYK